MKKAGLGSGFFEITRAWVAREGRHLSNWHLNCGGEKSNKNIGEERNHGISCKFSVYLEDNKRLRGKMGKRWICT